MTRVRVTVIADVIPDPGYDVEDACEELAEMITADVASMGVIVEVGIDYPSDDDTGLSPFMGLGI